eukprot:m.144425 g.144425  ORF g.144425 m.144425 type:complete len:253 (+) comp17193_c0_seq3:1147-1905(+)
MVFHERQEGALCAQHALNSLLQGPRFTAVDLADHARQLDDAERQRMAEGGTDSLEYLRFMQQPSQNYDDSGFFSVSVISSALQVWDLSLIPFDSPEEAAEARKHPEAEEGFICNQADHWLTLRRVHGQWYNLNSLLKEPQQISDTYLAMFLAQLKAERYIVRGVFPPVPTSPTGWTTGGGEEADLAAAIAASLESNSGNSSSGGASGGAPGVTAAPASSDGGASAAPAKPVDLDELRRKRLARLSGQTGPSG